MEFLRTDAIFMEILQERKTITGFLDAVFGFLRRNTDFYHVKGHPSENVGFAKGVREQILFGAMQRYDPDCKLNNLAADSNENDALYAPPAIEEVEIETEEIDMEQKAVTKPLETTKSAEIITPKNNTRKVDFAANDYKNGACFAEYCWSQTLTEVELHVKLPADLQSAKAICIDIKPDGISVHSRKAPKNIVINGKISTRYKHNDAVWTITEGKLTINMDKGKEMWWERFFTTEDPIDTKKIDCERYIDELPEDSQAAIQKLRVQQMEQDIVNNGQAINDSEKNTMERLRIAWDAEGSPFKGQPFDPSVVKFS
ncbi:PREDICTED: nudC domain-containing protein 3 [Bactrocera latifrons]|uniref:Nuclear migration protein nudC n=1 Tax=Bactrocera latifrons TaxID=174628 RepID=A0A0K8VBX7_BACLA|nr:PREDICTED: nudC domain-containing protein 3 [Bactrocera latifrons]